MNAQRSRHAATTVIIALSMIACGNSEPKIGGVKTKKICSTYADELRVAMDRSYLSVRERLVFELNKVFTDHRLVDAALTPAMALLALGETTMTETVLVLAGTYSMYGDTLNETMSPTQTFNELSGTLIVGAKISVGSVETLAQSMAQSDISRNLAGMKITELIAVTAVLQNSLRSSGISGTKMQRIIILFQRHVRDIASVFDLDIDFHKPINSFQVLRDMLKVVNDTGNLTQGQVQVLQAVFDNDTKAIKSILATTGGYKQLAITLENIETTKPSEAEQVKMGKNIGIATGALDEGSRRAAARLGITSDQVKIAIEDCAKT